MSPTEQLRELAEVPVVLEAEAARRNCRLEELMALQPGTLIYFPQVPIRGPVQIYAGNILLASAEICQSKGQAAVRVTTTDPEGADHGAR